MIHRNQINEFFSNNDPEFNGEVINFKINEEKSIIFKSNIEQIQKNLRDENSVHRNNVKEEK